LELRVESSKSHGSPLSCGTKGKVVCTRPVGSSYQRVRKVTENFYKGTSPKKPLQVNLQGYSCGTSTIVRLRQNSVRRWGDRVGEGDASPSPGEKKLRDWNWEGHGLTIWFLAKDQGRCRSFERRNPAGWGDNFGVGGRGSKSRKSGRPNNLP